MMTHQFETTNLFRSARIRHWLACMVLVGAIVLKGCSAPAELSPEEQVRATISALEEAAEKRSLSAFMQHISPDYTDIEGRSWDDIQRMVQIQYIRNQNIHLFVDISQLEISGNTASVELSALMAARAADLATNKLANTLKNLRANSHHFSVVLARQATGADWQVISVVWRRNF